MTRTLFLSTVTGDFGPLRKLLGDLFSRTEVVHVRHQDGFFHSGVKTLQMLEEEVGRSELVIHVIGTNPGWSPPDDQVRAFLVRHPDFEQQFPEVAADARQGEVSATQWEVWLGLFFGKRVASFEFADRLAPDSSQARHAKRLHDSHNHPKKVGDESELIKEVLGTLITLNWLTREAVARVQKIAPSRLLHHAAEQFLGRGDELKLLDDAFADGTHFLALIAWGGVGKTALLCEWLRTRFVENDWKDVAGRPAVLAYFDWSFYDQGTRSLDDAAVRTGSVGDFFERALTFFGDPNPSAPGKGTRLADLVRGQRTLLVLDGLEPLQQPPSSPLAGQLLDPDLRDLVTSLAQANPGLCVVTSRQTLTDLDGLEGRAARHKDLDDLAKPIAIQLLRRMQITGTEEELAAACDRFGCHALSLTLLGRFLFDAHGGDIRKIDHVRDLHRADELTRQERHRTAWKVLAAYEEWLSGTNAAGDSQTLAVLRLTGLFDRTATPDCLRTLRAGPVITGLTEPLEGMKDYEWRILLRRLERAKLIKLRAGETHADELGIDAHPLVREYFAEQLRRESPAAFQEAHSRLFDHLCQTTEYRPDTLAALQPLYQAVTHGCLAGRHEEARAKVYRDRILRGTESGGFYSTRQLGAIGADLGAIAAFFEEPWSRLSPNLASAAQAWLFNSAGLHLRALGRLTESLVPMRVSLEMCEKRQDSREMAICASNLSQLEVTLGHLSEAVEDGRRGIDFADRSGDAFQRIQRRTVAAAALHQAGQREAARTLFGEAERLQAEMQTECPWLYSLRGFEYVDLLLASAERGAWQGLLARHARDALATREACLEATRRAQYALEIATENRWLLDIALDHLTLARAALYDALLSGTVPDTLAVSVATALSTLRQANALHMLPLALLTAALHAGTVGRQPDEGRRLLDEAELIARRGPMPLYLADVHLHRARLFRDKSELADARALIETHGYHRRDEELADAEEAAKAW